MPWKFLKVSIVFSTLSICLFLGPPRTFAALNDSSLSADEMLEYTLDNLQNRMHELADTNRMTVNKNEALNQRIFGMRQEIRDLENKRMDFKEFSNDIQETTGLHVKEVQTIETRLRNMYQHKVDMLKEQEILNAQIKAGVERNAQLESKVKEFGDKIDAYKKDSLLRANNAKASAIKEKVDLKSLIEEKRGNVNDLEKQVRGLEKKVGDLVTNRNMLQAQQSALQQDLILAEGALSTEQEKEKDLQGSNDRMADERKDNLRSAQNEIKNLHQYAQTLKSSVNNLQNVQQQIAREFSTQGKTMNQWQTALKEEEQLLQGRQSAVENPQDNVPQENSATSNVNPDDLAQRLVGLKGQQDVLKEKLASGQEQQKILTQRSAEVSQAVGDTQKVLQKVIAGAASSSEKNRVNITKEINRLIRQQELKNNELENKLDVFATGAQGKQSHQQELAKEQKMLTSALEAEENNLQKLIAEEIVLRETGSSAEALQGQQAEEVNQAVEALRLHKMNLSNSLSLIKAKYGEEKSSVEGFTNEQEHLEDYLKILQQENSSLQEKALSLTVATDRLKTQRQSLLPGDGSNL